MPFTSSGPGGVIRAPIQRVDAQGGLGTLLKGLGQGVSAASEQKMAEDAARNKALENAQGVLANAPTPGLPAPGLSTEMTMPGTPNLPAARPVPGFEQIMAGLPSPSTPAFDTNLQREPGEVARMLMDRDQFADSHWAGFRHPFAGGNEFSGWRGGRM